MNFLVVALALSPSTHRLLAFDTGPLTLTHTQFKTTRDLAGCCCCCCCSRSRHSIFSHWRLSNILVSRRLATALANENIFTTSAAISFHLLAHVNANSNNNSNSNHHSEHTRVLCYSNRINSLGRQHWRVAGRYYGLLLILLLLSYDTKERIESGHYRINHLP